MSVFRMHLLPNLRSAVLALLCTAGLSGQAAPACAAEPEPSPHDATLGRIRAAGRLACGVVTGEAEYNKEDRHSGLDDLGRELCKAIAVAALGDAAKMQPVAYPSEQLGLQALATRAVDVVIGVTPAASAQAIYGVQFGPVVFYDGLGVMAATATGIAKFADLDRRVTCFIDGTETQRMLDATLRAKGIGWSPYPFQEDGEMDAALVVGRCEAMAADVSTLAEKRSNFHGRSKDFDILPGALTLDPAAVAWRQDDPHWGALVDWTIHALIEAEAEGVTQANAGSFANNDNPVVQRLVGTDFATAQALGLPHDWTARVIGAVGNYGEIYDRTVGEGSPLRLPRGLNALWTQGGLMRPLPLR
jgi:general L-amino acid transport system substrate-binding protein